MTTATDPAPAPFRTPAAAERRATGRPAARRSRLVADLVSAVVAASLTVVVVLWVTGGGLTDLTIATGPALTSLGRLTGLVSADLLLLQVLAMARVPVVERALGQDRLARWHRVLGFTSFSLLLGHVALVTVGYAATTRTGVLGQLWDLVWTYPGMLLATAGTAALVMVVVTSVRAARRRLRYESWHLLHLYAYLGVGLALPHQLWAGSDFVASPAARAYWWTLYLATLAAVVVFRVALPAYRNLRHRLVVRAVVDEAPGVVSLHVGGRDLDRMGARPGQFFVWRFLDGPGWSRGNPYSLSAPVHPDLMRVTVKDLGDGSRRLAEVRPGTRVLVEGPYGTLTADRRTRPRVTLIGAGIGITPLRAIAEDLDLPPGDVTLVHRAGDESDLVLRAETEELARARGIRLMHLVGPRPTAPGRSWLPAHLAHVGDAEALRRIAPDIARQDVFVCGPDGWMATVQEALADAGVPPGQVHVEHFSW
ncbi:MAG TPA: ferredoxin reductase family protein [Micromonosporaceae bacterium]|nr:ferredoxin reductase family protein [Micromonosporaceae bacterium]